MFNPGEIVYGYVTGLGFQEPKNKYLITLCTVDGLYEVVACFTTSQPYFGVPEENIKHGAILRSGEYHSYVFEAGKVIGENPATGEDFAFPKRTTVTFDYGIRQAFKEDLHAGIQNAEVVCKLYTEELGNLLYAMYKSPHTHRKYKPILERSLAQLYAG